MPTAPTITYIGGPTALISWRGLNLLTDPTFDPAGSEYSFPAYTLRKTQGPAIAADALPQLDAVLLSHDHHADNLDLAGRDLLRRSSCVIGTIEAAGRLGEQTIGLAAGQSTQIAAADSTLLVEATAARHGPEGADRGPVIGFCLAFADAPEEALYFSGDTVLYPGLAALCEGQGVRWALLNCGAARVPAVGPQHLTLTAAECLALSEMLGQAAIVPLHFEGWEHFSEGLAEIEAAFASAGRGELLHLPTAGQALRL